MKICKAKVADIPAEPDVVGDVFYRRSNGCYYILSRDEYRLMLVNLHNGNALLKSTQDPFRGIRHRYIKVKACLTVE